MIIYRFPDHDRAGAAITFAATDLGAHEVAVIADKIEEGRAGGHVSLDGVGV